ncbi:MAG: MinD/ParA family protein [Bacillota bacterium]
MADQAERLRAIVQGQRDMYTGRRQGASRIIVVASGKGGVGKTNLVVNMALTMGQLGYKTMVLDADLGMANVDILLDLKPVYTLIDVMCGDKELRDVILHGPCNLEVLPGGSCIPEIINLDSRQREQLIARLSYLEEEMDILFVDCSAGISRNVVTFISAADELVLITTPEPTAITDVYSVIKVVDKYCRHANIGLIVNMVSSAQEGEQIFQRIARVCHNFLKLELIYLGSVNFDQHVQKAVIDRSPYVLRYPRSPAARATQQIARHLLGVDKPNIATGKENKFLKRLMQMWAGQAGEH